MQQSQLLSEYQIMSKRTGFLSLFKPQKSKLNDDFARMLEDLELTITQVEALKRVDEAQKADMVENWKNSRRIPISRVESEKLRNSSSSFEFSLILDEVGYSDESKHFINRLELDKNSIVNKYRSTDGKSKADQPNSPTRLTPAGTNLVMRTLAGPYAVDSPGWYIIEISNRNISMKALLRLLTAFKDTLSLESDSFIRSFVQSNVFNQEAWGISGLKTLEQAFNRMENTLRGEGGTWYANAVLEDELRLEVVHCIYWIMQHGFGLISVLNSSLIPMLIKCFEVPSPEIRQNLLNESKFRVSYLTLRTFIAEMLGPLCLLEEAGKVLVINTFTDLSKRQNEPHPFFGLVQSMENPFDFHNVKRAKYLQMALLVDDKEIWAFRTSLMVFFNGLVSSGKSGVERTQLRLILDSCGLRNVLRKLSEQFPSPQFEIQMRSYSDDQLYDMIEREAILKNKQVDIRFHFKFILVQMNLWLLLKKIRMSQK